jgi:subtilisin family serine protease
LTAALAVPLVALGTPAGAAPPSAAGPAGTRGAAASPTAPLRWVTLPTGDKVALRPGLALGTRATIKRGDVLLRPAAGREKVRFVEYADHGDALVLPADAAPLVAAGKLDRRLFNITQLIRYGYDDAKRADIPLIVDYAGGAGLVPAARVEVAASARVERELPAVNGQAVRADKAGAGRFWAAVRDDLARQAATPRGKAAPTGVAQVWLDGPVRATLDQSVPQIGAPAAWQAGYKGAGSTVAILDTGIDATHPDLADAVVAARDFTESESGTDDRVGHGTHVASIVTGNGAASGGRYTGVAPDAKLLVGKVLDDNGFGFDSGIIAGMEWAAEQHARVVNMSFGSSFSADGTDPIEQALTRLTAGNGPLFVVAAGNDGPVENIGSPAEVDAALTVGAVDKQDRLADFSSRGPARSDKAIKPEITAPGVDIVAAKAANGVIGDPVGDSYVRLSGTSMATPHVAGAAAILAAQHPDWTAEQLKAALIGAAAPQAGQTIDQQGAGRVDVARAVRQPVYATPAVLNEGIALWPHADDPVISRTVTYRNDGTQPVTLDLAVDAPGAPAGMFTLSAPRVTVPAGGSASAVLSTNTTSGPDARYTGVLTATGGGTAVRTPVGVVKEVESYDVRVNILDRTGAPTPNYGLRFVDVSQPLAYLPYDASGSLVARLPKGHYYFETFVQTQLSPDPFDTDITTVFEPEYVVSGPATLTVDARQGKPAGVTVDRPAGAGQAEIDALRDTSFGGTGSIYFMQNFDGFYVVPSRTVAAPGQFAYNTIAVMARPDGAGGFAGSPYQYHVSWSQDGRVPAQLIRHLRDRDLTVAPAELGSPIPGVTGIKDGVTSTRLPATMTEFFSPGSWSRDLNHVDADGNSIDFQFGVEREYAGRRAPTERWNGPVYGPAFPAGFGVWVARLGDTVGVDIPLFSDQVADHLGFSNVNTGSTSVFRDGHLLDREEFAGSAFLTAPAGPGTFRVETEAERSGISPLSTRISAAWTFRSGTVAGDEFAPLPLAAVRFAPPVDQLGRPPAGLRVLPVPVFVQRQDGGGFGAVTSLGVEVSYDDGAHWRRVVLAGTGDHRVALVPQPSRTGFVSLRTSAADGAGNTVEETIIRAYALR